MHSAVASVKIDSTAFRSNDDGTWTVLDDTKVIVTSEGSPNGTILLPEGTCIQAQMFNTNGVDLLDLLNVKYGRYADN